MKTGSKRLTFFLHHRFFCDEFGDVRSRGDYHYSFFKSRFLNTFDEVVVVARLEASIGCSRGRLLTGPGVSFEPLANWRGVLQMLLTLPRSLLQLRSHLKGPILFTLPSPTGFVLQMLLPHRQAFGIQVISDPAANFSRGTFSHPMRAFFRTLTPWLQKWACRNACAVAYVSRPLASAYPCLEENFVISDVYLPPESFAPPRTWPKPANPGHLLFVGHLHQPRKDLDTLLRALARLHLRPTLHVVGEGARREQLQELCSSLGVADSVVFLGEMADRTQLLQEMDLADLFILPTLAEGTPRALLEAMARGLPCLANDVGGIPDLIAEEFLFPVRDDEALAWRIQQTLMSPEILNRMSLENHQTALKYSFDNLQSCWDEFCEILLKSGQSVSDRDV